MENKITIFRVAGLVKKNNKRFKEESGCYWIRTSDPYPVKVVL